MKYSNLIIAVLIFFAAIPLSAQPDDNRKPMKEEIEKIMKQKLMDRLSLDESTADRFLNSYKENNKRIRELNKSKKDLMETIELDPSSSDMDSKLDRLLDIETQMLDQRKSFFNELRTYLSPQQIAKTMILRRNFEKEFRKEIQKRKREKQ